MIKAVLFDLDGTLLPMNEDEFTERYFGLLCKKLMPLGYDKDELVKTIWAGTKAMIKNDGTKTNEEVFWNVFVGVYGEGKIKDKALFDEFYLNEFKQSKMFCGENPLARETIDFVKSKGLKLILASNPVFPRNGMITRLGFVGLDADDFDYITGYENSHYTKPNPKYFEEILKNYNLKANEVVMFGNSENEDYLPASAVGIKAYLVGDVSDYKNNKLKFEDIKEVLKDIK